MIILNIIYLLVFLLVNIRVIKKENKVDNSLLFDLLSTNTLVFFRYLIYFVYKNINYTILFDFILIFIYEVYKKDLRTNKTKKYITFLELVNLLSIILLFRYII